MKCQEGSEIMQKDPDAIKKEGQEHSLTNNHREIFEKTDDVIQLITQSEEYRQYHEYLKELKASSDIYEKLNAYRKESLSIQVDDKEVYYETMQELYEKYKDVLGDRLVTQFLITEQSICKMMRTIYSRFSDEIDLDISYIN